MQYTELRFEVSKNNKHVMGVAEVCLCLTTSLDRLRIEPGMFNYYYVSDKKVALNQYWDLESSFEKKPCKYFCPDSSDILFGVLPFQLERQTAIWNSHRLCYISPHRDK